MSEKVVMRREPFLKLVREAMDSLPRKFRRHIQNVAVVVEDHAPEGRDPNDLLMGVFEGTPRTKQGFFGADTAPNRIVVYQKNVEAHAEALAVEQGRSLEETIRQGVRLTILHEFGHYFGLDEDTLEDL